MPQLKSPIVDREEILDRVWFHLFHQRAVLHLEAGSQPKQQPRVVLTGNPGIGKSAIALAVTHRIMEEEQCSVFWINASQLEDIQHAFERILITGEKADHVNDATKRLVYYLNWEFHHQWLMVLDNIDGQTLQHLQCQNWLPSGIQGRLLLTTRDSSCLSLLGQATEIRVPSLEDEDPASNWPPALRPLTNEDYLVAMICSSQVESDAIYDLFDDIWNESPIHLYNTSADDPLQSAANHCCTGRIGGCNVVLARGPDVAWVVEGIRSNFKDIQLIILVGSCDGIPRVDTDNSNGVFRGDVVVSQDILLHDMSNTDRYNLQASSTSLLRLSEHVRPLLAVLEADMGWNRLRKSMAVYLKRIQSKSVGLDSRYTYPGAEEDKLFASKYRHKHSNLPKCICKNCYWGHDPICSDAKRSSCYDLGCNNTFMEIRHRKTSVAGQPSLHYGRIATIGREPYSAEQREQLIETDDSILAFTKEKTSSLHGLPCIMVKAVAGYGDSHNDEIWRHFAAATAASTAKALMVEYNRLPPYMAPANKRRTFVTPMKIVADVLSKIAPHPEGRHCRLTAIVGRPVIRGTEVALAACQRLRQQCRECSIFWISADSAHLDETLRKDLRRIGRRLRVPGIENDHADAISLLKDALGRDDAGSWLFVIDDVEGTTETLELLTTSLPRKPKGSILYICRDFSLPSRLGVHPEDIVPLVNLDRTYTRRSNSWTCVSLLFEYYFYLASS